MQNGVHRVDAISLEKWAFAGEHFANNHAEGKQVASPINSLAKQLFRRHVVHSSKQRP